VNNTPCGPGQLTFATQTDRTSYPLGTSVMISVMVRNLSSHPCTGPGLCGIGPSARVSNAATGSTVWRQNAIAIACVYPPPAPPRLAPGESHSYPVAQWNQNLSPNGGSSGTQVPGGTYQGVVTWLLSATPVPFTLTGLTG